MRRVVLGALVLGALAACGSSASAQPAAPRLATSAAPVTVTRAVAITKVLTIVEENHGRTGALNGMPYLASLAHRYAYATAYTAVAHPSLPNYLALVGGDTFGVTDDGEPSQHALRAQTVFGQALGRGKTARLYTEHLPSACATGTSGRYAVRHAVWPYFVGERTACQTGDVALGSPTRGRLVDDIKAGHLPNVGFAIPDICNDAHDCGLGVADRWLQALMTRVLAGPDFRSGRLAVVITFDEDDHSQHNQVLTVVLHPSLAHRVVTTKLNHFFLVGFMDHVLGAPALRKARGAASFAQAFGLP